MKKVQPEWISESEAAKLMGYVPKVFRWYVRKGKLDIDYTKINYKTYEYDRNSIERYKLQHSTIAA